MPPEFGIIRAFALPEIIKHAAIERFHQAINKLILQNEYIKRG
jgi:hypothetical protein